MYQKVIDSMKQKLEQGGLYPLKAQAELSTRILKERLEVVLPWAMEKSGMDMWIVLSRENCEDPIIHTLFTWDMPEARRISILMFHRNPSTGLIRRMAVGMHSPEMSQIYENVQGKDETVWEAAGRMVAELAPENIAVDRSFLYGFCDGLSSTLYENLKEAVGEAYASRICDGEELTVRWLQRVSPLEKETMRILTSVTHDIVDYTFSGEFVKPGVTTTTDIEWCMREMISSLGYSYWFGPDVDLQRKGSNVSRMFHEVILPGDLIHCDIGLNGLYVHLHTDMQWVAYILKEGETKAPAEFEVLFDKGNRFREIVMEELKEGVSGNEVFASSVQRAKDEGICPMLYTHPLGTFGHGSGPSIGQYGNQGFLPGTGERPVEDKTCYALELNVYDDVALWEGQQVFMYLEEDICKDGKVEYLDGHQEKLLLI
ncbi:M24 family metallopeptidase [bacterium 1XD21-13]|nr:M24 family metallopeptidase [bacterium 1XD21-13]